MRHARSPPGGNLLALHGGLSSLITTSCCAGSNVPLRILRITIRTLTYIALILKELSFLCDISFLTIPLWVSAQSVSSARIGAVTSTRLIRAAQCADLTVTAAAPGYSAVLLTVLAGWDASPRKIRAAIAWGIISAARYPPAGGHPRPRAPRVAGSRR